MGKPKVVQCETCWCIRWNKESAKCSKGHRMIFVKPVLELPYRPWGYRRSCADYKERS